MFQNVAGVATLVTWAQWDTCQLIFDKSSSIAYPLGITGMGKDLWKPESTAEVRAAYSCYVHQQEVLHYPCIYLLLLKG